MHRSIYSQQPQEPTTLARFQLAKFSYTTLSINHRGPLTWSHVFGNENLLGIFESYAALSSTRVLFRVVHNGWETLEEVGITDLVKESEEQRRSQDSSRRPAFAVVVKLPCLAVKYPQGPGYVRRFQVKFSSDRDFYSALATLSDINCPFAESNVSSVRPMSGAASLFSNPGQYDPISRSQHCPPTATENSTTVIGMALPYRAATTSSAIAHPSDAVFPASSSSSTTINSTSRQISTLGGISRTSFGSTSSTPNVQPPNTDVDPFKRPCTSIASSAKEIYDMPPASPSQSTDRCSRPSTSTCFQDLDLPPKRVLPFSNRAAKRSRPSPGAAEKAPPKYPGTGTADTSSSPPKSKKAASTQRAAKGRKPPKKDQTILPSSATPEDLTKSPDQQITISTATAKTTSTPEAPFEHAGLPTPANLAKYTSEPTADRTASLQAWLCAHLEDPNFLQLCEDVEGIAERFYLGKERRG
ncbi:hypothetical protein BDW67DRAFT_183783 [Aspergillus spinulosporus]